MGPGRCRSEMPGHYRHRTSPSDEPRPRRAKARVDGLACGRGTDAAALRPGGGVGQQRIARAWISKCRRVVAFELRYAGGSTGQGSGPPLGPTEAVVSIASRIRARAASKKIWKRPGAGEWAHSGSSAGQSLEPGVE